MSDLEYEIITTVGSRNFREPSKAPIPETWMIEEDDNEDEEHGGGRRLKTVNEDTEGSESAGAVPYAPREVEGGAVEGGKGRADEEEQPRGKKGGDVTWLRFVLNIDEATLKLLNLIHVSGGEWAWAWAWV